MLTNKEEVIRIVESGSGIGVADLAARLRLDKGTARKVALEAVREGRLRVQSSGQGYVFFPGSIKEHVRVIGADFREVPTPAAQSSAGRAVVPAEQPYDSRTEAVLRQHAAGRRRSGDGNGEFPSPIAGALNALFAADPSGDKTLAALAVAWQADAAATRAAEVRAAQERDATTQQRRAGALAAESARRAAQERVERLEALRAVSQLWVRTPPPASRPSPAAHIPSGAAGSELALANDVNAQVNVSKVATKRSVRGANSVGEFFVRQQSNGGARNQQAVAPTPSTFWGRLSGPPKRPVWK